MEQSVGLGLAVAPLVLVELVEPVSLEQVAGQLSVAAELGQIFESWFEEPRSVVFGSLLVIDLGTVLWMLSQLGRRFSVVGRQQWFRRGL